MSRVLVACEFSGRVRDTFRAKGHDAVSCDIVPTDVPGPHIQGDVRDILNDGWDLLIAFPPCQYLTKSNAWRWQEIAAQRDDALRFVQVLMGAPIPRIAVENPAGAIGTHIRPATQYVHPWHFGEPWQKQTGLWLMNLPPLVPTVKQRPDDVKPYIDAGYGGRRRPYEPGRARNPKQRSLTFQCIAQAMADQWGNSE